MQFAGCNMRGQIKFVDLFIAYADILVLDNDGHDTH